MKNNFNNYFNAFKAIEFNFLSKTCKENGCILDSSTIIYLDKLDKIFSFADNYRVITTNNVIEELYKNDEKQLNSFDIFYKFQIIKDSYDEEKIEVLNNEIKKNSNLINLYNKLSLTDKSLLFCSLSNKLPIFTDDGMISKISKSLNLDFYNSLIAIILLYYDKVIDKNDALNSLHKLNNIGRYSDIVFSYAFHLLEKVIKQSKI